MCHFICGVKNGNTFSKPLIGDCPITATSILPGVSCADAIAPDLFQSSPLMHQAEPPNFCAATVRRLAENCTSKWNSPGSEFAFALDCEGIAPHEEAGRIGGVHPVRGGAWQGSVGGGAESSSRGGGQPELAAELDEANGSSETAAMSLTGFMGSTTANRQILPFSCACVLAVVEVSNKPVRKSRRLIRSPRSRASEDRLAVKPAPGLILPLPAVRWLHSIRSSARLSTEDGMVKPSTLAVRRLMTS